MLRRNLLRARIQGTRRLLRQCALQQSVSAVLHRPLLPQVGNLLRQSVLLAGPRLLPRSMLRSWLSLLQRAMLAAKAFAKQPVPQLRVIQAGQYAPEVGMTQTP